MKVTLDRVEGSTAILLVRDDERFRIEIPVELMPEGLREGDILDISISRDDDATEEARKRVQDLIDKLKKRRHPEG